MNEPRAIEYLPLNELIADPRNPKTHEQSTINESIDRFGLIDVIVRDERTGYIISGHGRRKVLADMQQSGNEPPEGVKLADDGSWLVPVMTGWASSNDDEAGAALIALNRTTELGGWDNSALVDLLGDLSTLDDGMLGVGFSLDDFAELRENTPDASDFDLGNIEPSANPDLSTLQPKLCQSCGYDTANNPKQLAEYGATDE